MESKGRFPLFHSFGDHGWNMSVVSSNFSYELGNQSCIPGNSFRAIEV